MHVYLGVGESASERQRPREKKGECNKKQQKYIRQKNRRNHKRL